MIDRVLRILLVDDDDDLLMMLQHSLLADGHIVTTAGDGAQALKLIELEEFDLMITDIIMPEKEGIETIMELRARHFSIPVIAMSGGGQVAASQYLAIAKKLGAKEVLNKPFGLSELRSAINRVLENE